MRKRWPIALAFLLILLAALWWSSARSREPSYAGRPLSRWLSDLYQSNLHVADLPVAEGTRERAQDAVRHIGTNALPILLKMLRSKDSQFKVRLVALANKQHLVRVPSLRTRERHLSASFALLALGPAAKAAEPALVDLMFYGEEDVRGCSKVILKLIDPDYIAKLDDLANAGAK